MNPIRQPNPYSQPKVWQIVDARVQLLNHSTDPHERDAHTLTVLGELLDEMSTYSLNPRVERSIAYARALLQANAELHQQEERRAP